MPGDNILATDQVATATSGAGRGGIDDHQARRPVASDLMASEPRRSVVLLPPHALNFRVSLARARVSGVGTGGDADGEDLRKTRGHGRRTHHGRWSGWCGGNASRIVRDEGRACKLGH